MDQIEGVEATPQVQAEQTMSIEDARMLNNLRQMTERATQLLEAQARGEITRGPILGSPRAIHNYFHPLVADLPTEQLRIANLNQANELISESMVYQGTAKGFEVRLAEFFKKAIVDNATKIAIVHNHPSGNTKASPADIRMTQRAMLLGNLLGIDVLDHMIITRDGFNSMRSNNQGFDLPKDLSILFTDASEEK